MSFQGTGDPQAVNVDVAFRYDRHPCVLGRNILNKALAPFFASVKDKPLIKSLFEPFLFYHALLVGHGTADVFLVNIVLRNPDIVHLSTLSLPIP